MLNDVQFDTYEAIVKQSRNVIDAINRSLTNEAGDWYIGEMNGEPVLAIDDNYVTVAVTATSGIVNVSIWINDDYVRDWVVDNNYNCDLDYDRAFSSADTSDSVYTQIYDEYAAMQMHSHNIKHNDDWNLR